MPFNAIKFRNLHRNSVPLRLANAWDAGSARTFESVGATAIATSSAAVAWALGYKDGRSVPIDEIIRTTARMMRVLTVPLSWDIENGYSDNPRTVAENVMRLVDQGIAGINLEDGSDAPAVLAAKIEAIRNALSRAGTDLFINARTDIFLASLTEDSERVDETVSRGRLYSSVGADGLFVPGLCEAQHIKAIVEHISFHMPLNVMAWPDLADAEELGKLGVRRLSAGSGIFQVLYGKAESIALDFHKNGQSSPIFEAAMPYAQLQSLFSKK
jgi:2-methylisocitrate lyase-like PEP mutase family enzyme